MFDPITSPIAAVRTAATDDFPRDSAAEQAALNEHLLRTLKPVLGGLAALHGIFVLLDLLLVAPNSSVRGLTSQGWLAGFVTVVLLGLRFTLARRQISAATSHLIGAIGACAILARVLDSLRVLGPESTIADPALFVVGVGCFFLSRGWHASMCVLVLSSWIGVAVGISANLNWATPALYQLLSAVTLSTLVHEVRLRTYSRFAFLHLKDERQNETLRKAMEVVEANSEALKKNLQMMNCVLSNMPVVAFRLDGEGIIRESVGAGAGRTGIANRGIGQSALHWYPQSESELRRALAGESVHFEAEGTGSNGPWAYECFLAPDDVEGEGCVGFAIDSFERRKIEKERRRRNRFDTLLTRTTARFLASEADDVDGLIERSLGEVGEFLDVDFACLWKPSESGDPQFFRWDSPAAPPLFATPHDQAIAIAVSLTRRLESSQVLVLNLCDDSDPIRPQLSRCGLQSFVAIAVGAPGNPEGFVGFGSRRRPQVEVEGIDGLLRVFGDVCFSLLHRTAAEKRRRELESHIQQVMDHSPTIIFIKDRDGKFLFVNRRHEEIFHIPSDALRSKTAAAILPPHLVEKVERVNREVIETGIPQMTEEVVELEDGEHSYLSVRFALRNSDGEAYAVCGMATDVTEKKRVEALARKHERLLNEVLRHSAAVVFIKDLEGRYLYVNRVHEAVFDMKASDIQGKTDFDVLPRDVAEVLRAHDLEVIRRGEPITEEEIVPRNGVPHTYVVCKFPLHDAEGKLYATCGIATDVTELRTAQEAARKNEVLMRQFMEHSGAVFFIKDLAGRYLFVNQKYEEFLGITNEELKGKTDYHHLPRDVADAVMANDREVARTGEVITREEVVPYVDGVHTCVVVKFPLRDAQGEIYAVCGIATDITERKKNELALARSETRFRRFYESEAIGIIEGNFEGGIRNANDAFLRMVGYERSDLPLSWKQMTPVEFLPRDERAISQMTATGTCTPYQKEYVRKDGTLLPILLGAGLLDTSGNEVIGFVLDYSDLKRAERQIHTMTEQLEQVARMGTLGEMGAGIAHELHQSLFAMLNFSKAGVRKHVGRKLTIEWAGEHLGKIAAQAKRAGEIVARVRSFVTKRGFVLKQTDVNLVLDDALILARLPARDKDVSITVVKASNIPIIAADAVQISQVVVNLAINAIQALGEVDDRERKLTLETRAWSDGGVEIIVADNGPGISEEIRGRLFEQFVTTKSSGMGLGLAMSRSIVETHGGELWPVSVPGQGCAFHVTLPPRPPAQNMDAFGESTSDDEMPQFHLLDGEESVLDVEEAY